MKEDDVQTVMQHAATMIGSDTTPMKDGKPHPRSYGTYPRVLEHYVRERGVLTLEQAIHKCTGMVAQKLRVTDRGVLRAGARADVIVFAPERVHDHATYADPMRTPDGFAHVFVNGARAVKDGHATGARAGRVLVRT
jgi:N-acyl-D-amino-acid deacylase